MVTKKHKRKKALKEGINWEEKSYDYRATYKCPYNIQDNKCLFTTNSNEKYQQHMRDVVHYTDCVCDSVTTEWDIFDPDPSGIIFTYPLLSTFKKKCPYTIHNGKEIYSHINYSNRIHFDEQLGTEPVSYKYIV